MINGGVRILAANAAIAAVMCLLILYDDLTPRPIPLSVSAAMKNCCNLCRVQSITVLFKLSIRPASPRMPLLSHATRSKAKHKVAICP